MKRACLALAVLVVLACLAPVLAMVYDSLRDADGFSLAAYSGVFSEARQVNLFLRSLFVAAVATLLALVWGLFVAYAVSRLRGIAGATVETLSFLPLLLPSIVVVMGWIYLLGQAGIVTGWLKALFGLSAAPINLYTPLGAGFVLSLCYFPCVSILATQGFRSTDPAAVRAAHLAAGRLRRLRHIWAPLMAPYLATGALLVFLLAFSDFGVPSGLMVNVYPIETFAQFSAYIDVKRGIATCVVPVILAVALYILRRALVRATPHETLGASNRAALEHRVSRSAMGVAAVVILLSSVLPLSFLILTAGPLEAHALALRTAGEQVLTSLRVALFGMLFLLVAAVLFAAAFRGMGRRGRAVAEALVLLPLVVPGAAVGLGILYLVNHDVWPISSWYPHPEVVAYAAAARYVTFPALILAAAVMSLRTNLFQAAAIAGAGRVRTAVWIAAPLLWPGLVAAAALAFILCLGELAAAVLVNPPGSMTLPVRIASLLHFGKDDVVAALCLVIAAFILGILLLCILIANRPIHIRLQHADRPL
ncbi:MAG: ABC transporter permease [Planctomycetota bacterium]|jgi:ABC-type Fe3+ transport system permease subunit